MGNDVGGDGGSAGREWPAHGGPFSKGNDGEGFCENSAGADFEDVTAKEREVISRFLWGGNAAGGPRGRALGLALAALKFAAVLLVGAGIVQGYGDGDDFDEVGCTVAQQPGGNRHGERSAHAGERGDNSQPGSGGSAGGSDGGGPGGGAECDARATGGAEIAQTESGDWEAGVSGRAARAVVRAVEAAMERFEGKLEAARKEFGEGLVGTVLQIGRDLQAIARGTFELRKENQELKEMQGAGLFKFALRVDVEDFQAFAAVMALGNRKAAAEFLDVPMRTFYDRVDAWKSGSKDYQRMFRLVEWRKATGRKIQVRLQDSLLSSDGSNAENPETLGDVLAKMKEPGSDNRGYPEILRQVWQALQEQNAGNWKEVREELVEFLGAEVPQ